LKELRPELVLLAEAKRWLRSASDAREWRIRWWDVRRDVLAQHGSRWSTEGVEFLDAVDTAVHKYEPDKRDTDPIDPTEITESEMRARIVDAVKALEASVEELGL